MQEPNRVEIGYTLRAMEVLGFASTIPTPPLDSGKYAFTVNMGYEVHPSLRFFRVITDILLLAVEKEEDKEGIPALMLTTRATFELENLEPHVKEDEVNAPNEFLGAIANISVSTSRGILMGKNFGGPFASFLLPIIPTQDLLPNGPIKIPPKAMVPEKEKEPSS
jgi:hypothetical protein